MSKKSKKKAKIKSIYQPTGHELKSIYKPWGPEMSSAKIILDAFIGVNRDSFEFAKTPDWDDTPRKRLSEEEIENCKVMRAYIEVKLKTLIDMEKKYYDTLEGLQRYIGDNNLNNNFTNFTYYTDKHSDLVQFPIESIDFLLNNNTHEYKTEDPREQCSNCGADFHEMQEFNCTDFSIKTVLE